LLHKKGIGANKNKLVVDWVNSIGIDVPFIFDDISGVIKIITYDSHKRLLGLKYGNNDIYYLDVGCFLNCNIMKCINLISRDYRYHEYEVITTNNRDITILKSYNKIVGKSSKQSKRYYQYKCNRDNYIGEISEQALEDGCGCSVCSNHVVMKGVNDLWTTSPQIAKLLVNSDDGYKYTRFSEYRTDLKCPVCGNIIKNKMISNIPNKGLFCPKCNDGFSYPEKLMYNLLQQLELNFEYQYSPKWCKYKFKNKQKYGKYDFYLSDKQLIIETDGGWHGEDNLMSGQSLEESQYIDSQKDILAQQHDIEVIRIDCQKSELDYIKNNILKSKLSIFFNLLSIDWVKINQESQKSIVYEVCKFKNIHENLFTTEIAKVFDLSPTTVRRYLNIGNKNTWCKYNPKQERFKSAQICGKASGTKVICITTNHMYNSILEASRDVKIADSCIRRCCIHKQNYAGKLNGQKLQWMYYEDFIKTN
jgi:very-short-patch-repair endonuclease